MSVSFAGPSVLLLRFELSVVTKVASVVGKVVSVLVKVASLLESELLVPFTLVVVIVLLLP